MKTNLYRLFALLLLVATLLTSAVSCGDSRYDEGYRAGYEAAQSEAQTSVSDTSDTSVDTDISTGEVSDTESDDPYQNGFVMITDVVPDAILEIRYYSTFNFVGERINGYEAPVAYLTAEAANALKNVSDELMEQGYRIKVYDAYRPQTAVDHFKAWAEDVEDVRMKQYFYPEVDKALLFEEGYIAARSGHSRGSTVDLTLVDMMTGTEVDMGGGFDYFGELSHPSYTQGLTQEQINNRMILQTAMTNNGFRPLDTEWWHFTLIDEPYPDTYFDFPVAMPEG